jgi:hypothetical protein
MGDKMRMLIEIHSNAGLLKVVATGKFSLKEAKRTFLQMLEAVALHKAKKVLFDGQQLVGEPETMERFYYGEFAARSVADFSERGVSRATRFAYLLSEPVLDPERFGENVAYNRGMCVKAFDNAAEALQWLR